MGAARLPRPPAHCQRCGKFFLYNTQAVALTWHVDSQGCCLLYYWICRRCYHKLPAQLQRLAVRVPRQRKRASPAGPRREVFVSFQLSQPSTSPR